MKNDINKCISNFRLLYKMFYIKPFIFLILLKDYSNIL